jgi:N4-gp56 family major capsid protein
MAEIGLTEVSAVQQTVVANVVQQVLKQKSILLPTIMDYSAWVPQGSVACKVPRRTQFTAADKSENSALTAQELTFSADTISMDKHKAVYASLERYAMVTANVDVKAQILIEMAEELALQIDKDIIVELKLASTSAPDHLLDYANTPTDTLAIADITNARALLNTQNVPMEDRYLLISPTQEKALLNISDFVRADAIGSAGGLINGQIGRVFGFNVLMHSTLSAADAIFYHKSAVGHAKVLQPEFLQNVSVSKVADEFALHLLYGNKVLDSGKRQVYYNGSGS